MKLIKRQVFSKLNNAILQGADNELEDNDFEYLRKKQMERSLKYDCVMWRHRTVIPQKFQKQLLDAF